MTQFNFRRLINFTIVIGTMAMISLTAFAQGSSHLSDMKPGSVLFYNRYSSNPSNPQMGDTQINITNVSQNQGATVHLFLVDGSSCTIADSFVSLTPNQTASFLVSDFDPGIQGYIVAVATGGGGSGPTQFNFLTGTEFIRETDGRTAYLQAVAFAKRSAGDVIPDQFGTANLNFNGVDYEQLPQSLAVSTFNSQTTDSNTLVIYSPSSNLIIGAVSTVNVFTLLYNDAEVSIDRKSVV